MKEATSNGVAKLEPPRSSSRGVEPPQDATCGPDEHARRGREKPVSDEAFERAASLFRAAADVSRLKLLERLADGEWCVTELADAAQSPLSTVSQQLRMLRTERIVTRRRAGKHIFYSLADRHVIEMVRSALEHASERHAPPDDGEGDS